MEWFILALIAAVSHAILSALIKGSIKDIHRYYLAGGIMFAGGMLLALSSLIKGIPIIQESYWGWFFLDVIIFTVSNIYYFKSLEVGDLSLVIPMLSFTPAFMIFTSGLMLGEIPSAQGMVGIIFIVIGSYIINFEKTSDLLLPFKKLYTNKGIWYMLIVAFLYSVSGTLDKILIQKSDAVFSGASLKVLTGILFLGYMLLIRKQIKAPLGQSRYWLIIGSIGVFSAITTITEFAAKAVTLIAYVISVKRLAILFSILMGYFFFKERQFGQRFLGGAIMVVGMYLILMAAG